MKRKRYTRRAAHLGSLRQAGGRRGGSRTCAGSMGVQRAARCTIGGRRKYGGLDISEARTSGATTGAPPG